jgi:hypothetical protein
MRFDMARRPAAPSPSRDGRGRHDSAGRIALAIRSLFAASVALVGLTLGIAAQPPARIATTAGALVSAPLFFHGKQVVVRHAVEQEAADLVRLTATAKPVVVYWRERPSRTDGEIRGEFWDLGRLEPGDPRFTAYDFRPMLEALNRGSWPGRDRIFVLLGATLVESPLPTTPTIRSIALAPDANEGRGVTLVGRFRGRNLYGDLPQSLAKSKWDFVLQSADAALWVSGLRPRADGLNLDPGARVDTGRWVEVSGTVQREGDTIWIAGTSIKPAAAPAETPIEIARPPTPREPPPTVIFSMPVQDDTEVERAEPVRLQFSRDMDGRSFRNAVRVSYPGGGSPGATPPPMPRFTATYSEGTRSLEIQFSEPLERFQVVRVELLEGITAIDKQPLRPWVLTFTTGS